MLSKYLSYNANSLLLISPQLSVFYLATKIIETRFSTELFKKDAICFDFHAWFEYSIESEN